MVINWITKLKYTPSVCNHHNGIAERTKWFSGRLKLARASVIEGLTIGLSEPKKTFDFKRLTFEL